MRKLGFILVTLWAALFALLAPAAVRAENMHAELVAESERPAAGQTVTLAIRFTPKPGWHGYWKNPGDAGVESRFDWTLPKGVTVGAPRYPVPGRLLISGLMNYVYEGEHALLLDLTLPAGLTTGTPVPIRMHGEWLVCTNEVCVPERGDLALDLTVGDGAIAPERRALFDAWRARLPMPLGGQGHFALEGGALRIAVPLPADAAVADPFFYALTDGAIDYGAPQTVRRKGDRLIVEAVPATRADGLKSVEGVLAIGPHQGLAVVATPGAVPEGGRLVEAPAAEPGLTAALIAFAAAVVGGLLLNIMPCVFPILSLKALSLMKAGVDERAARREGVAYAAGVILTCLALGGALLALRAGGSAAGWAFQLQDPRIITLLLLLVTAIALNLAGLFELGSVGIGGRLAAAGGAGGAFWTGVLAAFVATPCTGPFLGTALGAALVLPTASALAIFAGLGLGLALPFLLLGFVPALRRGLPRPGPWMGRFRRILSVPMFLTALGLAWILGRQAGVDAMAIGLFAALLLGLALWWAGGRQGAGGFRWAIVAPALLIGLAVALAIPRGEAAAHGAEGGALDAEPFSEERLAALQSQGRPVFVNFTADWCLTCKVNEKTAIERPQVARAFREGNVAVLVGDWTNGDPAIGRFIQRHGRSGVPLYLFYRPGAAEPNVLPQLLTADRLVALAG